MVINAEIGGLALLLVLNVGAFVYTSGKSCAVQKTQGDDIKTIKEDIDEMRISIANIERHEPPCKELLMSENRRIVALGEIGKSLAGIEERQKGMHEAQATMTKTLVIIQEQISNIHESKSAREARESQS